MLSLKQIKKQLMKGEEIEEIMNETTWKDFEGIVSKILEKHEYKTSNNFMFKTSRKYEIDIIAKNRNLIFLIDCKQWSRGRYKSSALKKAAAEQEKRLEEFRKFIENNPIAKNSIGVNAQKMFPIVVTWYQEDLIKWENTFVIPVWKLNEFLLNLSGYI